jgi:hypothetical protein
VNIYYILVYSIYGKIWEDLGIISKNRTKSAEKKKMEGDNGIRLTK